MCVGYMVSIKKVGNIKYQFYQFCTNSKIKLFYSSTIRSVGVLKKFRI